MESRTIELTKADITNNKLNIRPCGKGFFPKDAFGGSSKKGNLGVPITLKVDGLPNPIQTDIPKDMAGRPRWLFRERAWIRKFVKVHNLHPDDTVMIYRVGKRTYVISPNNKHSQVIEKEHKATENKTPKKLLDISYTRTCNCPKNHINCLTAKEWLKCQLGVWQFTYEGRDIRDKTVHPATFPISLARKVIELFTHKGELVLDPFVGSGTTLVAGQDLSRNSVGFDLQKNLEITDFQM